MSEEIKKGLLGIVVDETTISHVVPELSALTYRGYTVQELCDKCDFEEVAYLVLNGELPNKSQLKKFIKQERSERKLSKQILNDIKKMPRNAHPMDVIVLAVNVETLKLCSAYKINEISNALTISLSGTLLNIILKKFSEKDNFLLGAIIDLPFRVLK